MDPSTKVAFAKRYERKHARVAADWLNDPGSPRFEQQQVALLGSLTDRGTADCGWLQQHQYQWYLAVEHLDPSRTKARHPQTNGSCERFHRTLQDAF
jgi:transposase InsO family protein